MARTFATNPPPPPFQNPSGAGSRVDQFLIAAAKDFEQKLKNQIIMLPNEYFLTMEKLFKMLDDPRNGTLSKEESVAAAIFLSVMLANSAPKLAPLEFVRSVTFLYHMTREIGFRLSAEHMKNIMFAIKDPLPSKTEMQARDRGNRARGAVLPADTDENSRSGGHRDRSSPRGLPLRPIQYCYLSHAE
ncbi:MAG: hypothetical protein P4L67_04200 [Candidatus Pacebacteria bacterium]|nr:hypothetical protein [Candidatus Paceibacterota bacterium]